jgi:hypothetical protein
MLLQFRAYATVLMVAVACAAVTAGALFYCAPPDGPTGESQSQSKPDARFALLQHRSLAIEAAAVAASFALLFATILLAAIAALT